jgi:hypothetical protein
MQYSHVRSSKVTAEETTTAFRQSNATKDNNESHDFGLMHAAPSTLRKFKGQSVVKQPNTGRKGMQRQKTTRYSLNAEQKASKTPGQDRIRTA